MEKKPNEEKFKKEVSWSKGMFMVVLQILFAVALLFYITLEYSFGINLPFILLPVIIGGYFYFHQKNKKTKFYWKSGGVGLQEEDVQKKSPLKSKNLIIFVGIIVLIILVVGVIDILNENKQDKIYCLEQVEFRPATKSYLIREFGKNKYFKDQEEALNYCEEILLPNRGKLDISEYEVKN